MTICAHALYVPKWAFYMLAQEVILWRIFYW
jgi:hypothetical protein